MENSNKKILLLTLVHPDFLPPVYAVGQVLRDLGYSIHILTFDSFVPAELDLGSNIHLESVGRHYDASTMDRIKLRNKFTKRAMELAAERSLAVISFCPFSFHTGILVKKKFRTPLIYHTLEISDFKLGVFLRSPLSNYRNYRALQTLEHADMVATPSIQRSAWLAGRCHLNYMPHTILNTAYIPPQQEKNDLDLFKQIVPAHFLNKKVFLYTGAVNEDLCVMELVQAFDLLNDADSALVITGVKDTEYCHAVEDFVKQSKAGTRISLHPYLARKQMLALQANAHIGVCLSREIDNSVKSKMIAPNKAGEYMSKDLYLLGTLSEYLRPIKMQGIASLAVTCAPVDVCAAMKEALAAVNTGDYKTNIRNFVKDFFCMQQQLFPVIDFLSKLK